MRKMMIRALGGALGLSMLALGASAASATSYTFDFTGYGDGAGTTGVFPSGKAADGSTLSARITAWHATDSSTAMTTDPVTQTTVGMWGGYGLGVLYGSDSSSTGTHQIDNVGGGVDMLMLQFSQNVTLSSLTEYLFKIDNVACCNSDASIWADTAVKTPNVDSTVALTSVKESDFTKVAGGTTSGSLTRTITGDLAKTSASVWVIGAAFNEKNDGFKLSKVVVNTTAAVPEPASWAMMIVGFGAVGGSLRARRRSLAFG